jgi:alginate O-acetyltransferase complex protein AlgI
MLFSSLEFLFFFIPYFLIHLLIPYRWKLELIIVGSLIFYSYWYPGYFWVPIVLTTIGYFGALNIEKSSSKKRDLILTLVLLFLPLLIFKYSDFIIYQFTNSENFELYKLGWSLPLGISFITFTMVAYVVESYKQHFPVEKSYKSLLAYILFFPQLIAGPIIRPSNLLPKLHNLPKKVDLTKIKLGLFIFSIGVMKKIVFADQIGVMVDSVYLNHDSVTSLEVLIASYGFSLQIYCDFSGYCDMAIGLGLILGIRLPRNFNKPYLASSISDFWRRWHITLSTWLRDYLFIPLGGSRVGISKTGRNLIITMVLGGIWHGAGWTFIFWGMIHGIALFTIHFIRQMRPNTNNNYFLNLFKIFIVFNFVSLSWIFFRSPDLYIAFDMFAALTDFSFSNVKIVKDNQFYLLLILIFLITHKIDSIANFRLFFHKSGALKIILTTFGLWILVISFGSTSSESFIYYDF